MLVHLIMLVLSNIWFVLSIHNKRDKFLVVMEDDILLKSAFIMERQDMWLIHAIENMVFHLTSSLKIIKQTVIITNRIMKVQGQSYILSKLVLHLSNIKYC